MRKSEHQAHPATNGKVRECCGVSCDPGEGLTTSKAVRHDEVEMCFGSGRGDSKARQRVLSHHAVSHDTCVFQVEDWQLRSQYSW